jgi:hypothetical protein
MTIEQRVPNAKDVRVRVQWKSSGCHRLIWKEYALRYLGSGEIELQRPIN